MKTPSCIVAGNPDVTGIGFRLALYIQCISIVIISNLLAKRKTIPPSLAAVWRTQMYYTIAIILAALVQRSFHQISLFHEFASFNLAYISLMAGIAAMGSEVSTVRRDPTGTLPPGTHAVHIPSSRPYSRPNNEFWLVTRFPATAQFMYYAARFLVMGLFMLETTSLSHGCMEENKVTWWFLGAQINLVQMWYLPVCIYIGSGVLSVIQPLYLISKLIFGETPKRGSKLRFVSPAVEFVVLVMGIEVSIHNNGLEPAENNLGYGQVISLVLLLPILEAWWEVLLGHDEESET